MAIRLLPITSDTLLSIVLDNVIWSLEPPWEEEESKREAARKIIFRAYHVQGFRERDTLYYYALGKLEEPLLPAGWRWSGKSIPISEYPRFGLADYGPGSGPAK